MAREFSRTERVGEQLQRELAQLITREIKDPRLGLVTINSVRVSRDLAYADVYVTVMGRSEETDAAEVSVAILNRAAGFLRSGVAARMKLRITPRLRFHYDASVERGSRLSSLIQEARDQDRQRQDDREED